MKPPNTSLPPPPIDQFAFTSRHEGKHPHIYLDNRGLPTAGIGFLLRNEQACAALPWEPNTAAALTDYRVVRTKPKGYRAAWYGQFCTARLSENVMGALFKQKIGEFRRAITRHWQLEQLPLAAQIALVDMAYTLGAQGLTAYIELASAVRARDWDTAAAECHRGGVSIRRNADTAYLFQQCRAA